MNLSGRQKENFYTGCEDILFTASLNSYIVVSQYMPIAQS